MNNTPHRPNQTKLLLTIIISSTAIFIVAAILILIHIYSNSSAEQSAVANPADEQAAEAAREEFFAKYPFAEDFNKRFVEQEGDEFHIFRIDIDQSPDCHGELCLRITDYSGHSQAYAERLIQESSAPDDIEIIYTYTPVN